MRPKCVHINISSAEGVGSFARSFLRPPLKHSSSTLVGPWFEVSCLELRKSTCSRLFFLGFWLNILGDGCPRESSPASKGN